MSYLTDIQAARDALAEELKEEAQYRAINGPKPSYSANGRQVSWNEWLLAMTEALKELNDLVEEGDASDDADMIYEIHTRGYT